MKLYYPIFDMGWKIETVDSSELHFCWHSYNGYNVYNRKRKINNTWVYGGTLMYSDRLFTDEKGVRYYINKQYGKAIKYLYFKEMSK